MNDSNTPSLDLDALIERVLGQEDDESTWRALRARAQTDPDCWERLADELETESRLRSVAEPDVVIPLPSVGPAKLRMLPAVSLIAMASGWLVALMVWVSEPPRVDVDHVADPEPMDRTIPDDEPTGVQIEALPNLVLRSKRLPDGTYEVVTMQRQIERRIVDEWTTWMRDESGQVYRGAAPVNSLARVARDI
ncbi:MAG: hypothetical protein AAF196_20780 [Planctomycetota bacterium]